MGKREKGWGKGCGRVAGGWRRDREEGWGRAGGGRGRGRWEGDVSNSTDGKQMTVEG